ncbi:hypothetical protein FC62_GL001415 [Amylolactobacillus amylotrophicus DSM 20534]|uniref:Uncharacterized protein n=3 Tax=Amylolactobacillus TaxID=2767876 RepID=A0A1L6XAM4_9LACO|nr:MULTISPECIES: YoaK family protein [Amylolactobacillus]APT18012.1 hypothetical protein LA20533_01155 [Amylolactobacillus amylophilus DSM 20533 = JCM 1125]KRK37299.1 hypothetical protein FC62_GL001415 [Amylolactobacillus amylotrophicus DSM 20534]KRM41698.1 hypothetical protein FD40_GL001261 [Amylolactobacillus amylophilus DSM 20533 = JCM 1125]GED80704.1 membrane protein [Amylolactobacillus amylophilus]
MREIRKPDYERVVPGMFLAASAGGLDAYSYLLHGEVFAGMQTGNLILLGINLGRGDFGKIGRYIFAIAMFMLGTIVVRLVQHKYDNIKQVSRPTFVLIYEMILLIVALILTQKLSNLLILAILSMAAAAQMQEFRKIYNGPYTPMMMTGNLRTISEGLYDTLFIHKPAAWKKTKTFIIILLSFLAGAVLNGLLVGYLGQNTIVISIIGLMVAIYTSHLHLPPQDDLYQKHK